MAIKNKFIPESAISGKINENVTSEQNFTDSQKEQARTNINAASIEYVDGAVDAAKSEVKLYADQIKSDIYGGVPNATLDTIAELATAFEENKDVVDTLNGAITNKQDVSNMITDISSESTDDKYPTAKAVFDFVEEKIEGGSAAIIDVVELPTENINKNAFYRLVKAKHVYKQELIQRSDYSILCVNSLPETGEVVTDVGMSFMKFYYSVQDNNVYGYVDNLLAGAFGFPSTGWIEYATLCAFINETYGGVITHIDYAKDDDTWYVLVSYSLHTYKDGWLEVPYAYETRKCDIKWDGIIGDRFVLDMSQLGYAEGLYFVKVSNTVLSPDDIYGSKIKIFSDEPEYEIYPQYIDTASFNGAFTVTEYITCVYNQSLLNTQLGLPDNYITNGVYFYCYIDDDSTVDYVEKLVSPVHMTKINKEFIDMENFIRYDKVQTLTPSQKNNVRGALEVYSTQVIDTKIKDLANNDLVIKSSYITTDYYMHDICYGDGKFIIIASDDSNHNFDRIFYSVDGMEWNQADFTNELYMYDICYGDGKFVAVGKCIGTKLPVTYSTDGIVWNTIYLEPNIENEKLNAICYNDGKFVAIGTRGTTIYSTDGINWNYGNNIGKNQYSICYGDGKFVAVGSGENGSRTSAYVYSVDGITWITGTFTDKYHHRSICYGNNKFIAIGYGDTGESILYSSDGINWNKGETNNIPTENLCYAENKYVGYTINLKSGSGIVYSSNGGKTWNIANTLHNGHITDICYGNNMFIACRSDGFICFSEDGITWEDRILSQSNTNISSEVAKAVRPHLHLTAEDVGALPADSEDTLNNKITSPSTATVGQVLIVKAVDDNGKPTEWETVDKFTEADKDVIKALIKAYVDEAILGGAW